MSDRIPCPRRARLISSASAGTVTPPSPTATPMGSMSMLVRLDSPRSRLMVRAGESGLCVKGLRNPPSRP